MKEVREAQDIFAIKSTEENENKSGEAVGNGERQFSVLGNQMNFAASEAYKLLRTNLSFSFSDGKESHTIGVTSALKGTGKTTTSINLAYTLSQLEKKVLLLECDLRLPSISHKISVNPAPGLSNVLANQKGTDEVKQRLSEYLDVITAGDVPPNPSELLGSERMGMLLSALSTHYEYIILDLPPVQIVSDALVVSKFVDGMVLVVRQRHDEKRDVAETINQLKMAKAKLVGCVFNCVEHNADTYVRRQNRYYRKGYYYKKNSGGYSNDYGSGYGYGYGYGKK